MSNPAGETFERIMLVILLAFGVVGFGTMGLCGAVFTFAWGRNPPLPLVSLPCLIAGAWLAVGCARRLPRACRQLQKGDDDE